MNDDLAELTKTHNAAMNAARKAREALAAAERAEAAIRDRLIAADKALRAK